MILNSVPFCLMGVRDTQKQCCKAFRVIENARNLYLFFIHNDESNFFLNN